MSSSIVPESLEKVAVPTADAANDPQPEPKKESVAEVVSRLLRGQRRVAAAPRAFSRVQRDADASRKEQTVVERMAEVRGRMREGEAKHRQLINEIMISNAFYTRWHISMRARSDTLEADNLRLEAKFLAQQKRWELASEMLMQAEDQRFETMKKLGLLTEEMAQERAKTLALQEETRRNRQSASEGEAREGSGDDH